MINATEDEEKGNQLMPEELIIDEKINEAFENGSDNVPAVIWYDPINQTDVDNEVFERTGLTIENIDIPYIQPPMDLLAELDKEANDEKSDTLSTLMSSYLNDTKEARRIEKELSDKYSNERREVIKELNLKKSQDVISQAGLNEDKVIFKSKYAPMIFAEISPDELQNLTNIENIKEIDYFEKREFVDCALENATFRNTMNINSIPSQLGLTGDEIKIGIYETSTVPTSPNNATNDYHVNTEHVVLLTNPVAAPSAPDHATMCAGYAAGEYGVAPEAYIYSASINDDWYNYHTAPSTPFADGSTLELLIDNNVKVVNLSFAGIDDNRYYDIMEKWIDSIIAEQLITVVVATNNEYVHYISIPSGAFNVISVNGFYKNGTEEILNSYSYMSRGCWKPDVISDSSNSGTSFAAPVVTGMIALLFEFKPSLANYPQATKAILLASCHRKMTKRYYEPTSQYYNLNEPMTEGLSDHQGAGVPDMYKMISIVAQHNYGVCELNDSNNHQRDIQIIQPSYGASNINFSMAYLQTNASESNSTLYCDDYDLVVYNNGTSESSAKAKSSTEMIYENLTSNPNYTMHIGRYSGTTSVISAGYAWSTDNIRYFPKNYEEGIYFIRNVNSNKMLLMDTATLKMYQNTASFNDNYMWILKKTANGQNYTLKNGATNDYGVIRGSLYNGSNYYATGNNSSSILPASIFLDNNSAANGTSKLIIPGSPNYYLQIYNNSNADFAFAVWNNSSNVSSRWSLERISYLSGDINRDGHISSADEQLIDQYLLQYITFNNLQLYLADANKDGYVNMSDSVWISNHTL